ncbi:hypothetical protein E2562_019569 [Oryza meyeriana var. granulata]|uniref:Uncharacterized protein n=1 Tax=Oryza meyeriana var. granulata TaxID=110450 RepID=A0A6G1BZU9_9ORYZ|nr:hypothetical protein E2562_019569 [Oryza meyeriana var. granulata]
MTRSLAASGGPQDAALHQLVELEIDKEEEEHAGGDAHNGDVDEGYQSLDAVIRSSGVDGPNGEHRSKHGCVDSSTSSN